jgi:hypothetical protein
MSKVYALYLVIAVMVSSLLIGNVGASYAKPSVPEFTINDTTVTIKNQPFTSYYDASVNRTIDLYYQIQTKYYGNYAWQNIETYWAKDSTSFYQKNPYQNQDSANQQATTIRFVSTERKDEFRVRALIGYVDVYDDHALDFWNGLATFSFNGECSDWSGTQTTGATEPTQAPQTPHSPSPTVSPNTPAPFADFGFNWQSVAIVGLVVAVAVLAVGLLLVWRRLASFKKPNTANL